MRADTVSLPVKVNYLFKEMRLSLVHGWMAISIVQSSVLVFFHQRKIFVRKQHFISLHPISEIVRKLAFKLKKTPWP
jgi:hypothetical protein